MSWNARTFAALAASLLLCTVLGGRPGASADTQRAEQMAGYRRPQEAAVPHPAENPFSPAKVELGRMLFFDPLLSNSGSRSCASCHNPGLSWGDGLARGMGDPGASLPLRSPTLLDIGWLPRLGWDGKFPNIEVVTFAAITGRANMALDEAKAVQRIASVGGYGAAFAAAFGDPQVTRAKIESAIATYERTLISGPAPFDRWIEGDEAAVNEAAKRGFDLFVGAAGCSGCHSGWAFTDGSFHDIGTARDGDIGRGRLFPSSRKLRYAFKVPTLRDVARRGPYMHDGSVATLEHVVELYDRGGIDRPSRSTLVKPLGLSPEQKADLVAFMRTLTSFPQPVEVPVLPR
jgi:cytochrome c peroxidase